MKLHPQPFVTKTEESGFKYLKTCMKFVIFYSFQKNDVNLQRKR